MNFTITNEYISPTYSVFLRTFCLLVCFLLMIEPKNYHLDNRELTAYTSKRTVKVSMHTMVLIIRNFITS